MGTVKLILLRPAKIGWLGLKLEEIKRKLKYLLSHKKSNNRSLCICCLKVIEGQISLSTLFGTLRVSINGSFFGYFDGLERSTF